MAQRAEPTTGSTGHARTEVASGGAVAVPQVQQHDNLGETATTTNTSRTVARFETFAHLMTDSAWQAISQELGDDELARTAKRQFAHHGWCDLLVGVIMAIEKFNNLLDKFPNRAKAFICRFVLRSTMRDKRPRVDKKVVGLVVDRVWSALKTVVAAKVPILAAVTNDDVLRMLRMLAVFLCPAPEKHREVREHALGPLGDDAADVLTEGVKKRLKEAFGG